MTDNSERFPDVPEAIPGHVARPDYAGYEQAATTSNSSSGTPQSEMASLVLLINTVLGGLGTVYVTTKSVVITLVSALQVLLIIVAVIVVKRRGGRDGRPGRKDDRSGW